MRSLRIATLALMIGAMCAGPALGQAAQPTEVKIVDFTYEPVNIVVDAGTTLHWTNTGARPHTVTDRGGTFDTGPISPNAKSTLALTVPGKYFFFCRINPSKMNGTIEVKPGPQLPKAVRVQAVDPARDLPLGFDPKELSVNAGTAIVFANVGGKPHSMTADDGSFDTGIVTPGAAGGRFAGTNATIIPTKGGTYPFHCEVHAVMKGVLTVTGNAPAGPGAASSAPNRQTLKIKDFEFIPKETSVAPGGTVTWSNTGSAQHTATFDDVDLDTKTIEPGKDASLVAPSQPGNYSYRCNIHPAKMRGVLVVVGQGVTDPTKTDYQKAAAASGSGPSGGLPALALITAVIGAFLGGFGVSAFVRNKPSS